MSYCQNCGNALDEGARFCSKCGQIQHSSSVARQPRSTGSKRLHCPQCKSNALSPVVETEISGGMSMNHSVSRKNSVSGFSFNNTHRNYWMCGNCGHKFRNLQNLEEELSKHRKNVKSAIIGVILVAVLMLLSLITSGFSLIMIFMIPALILIIAAIFITKNKINDLESEKTYLKKNCFG